MIQRIQTIWLLLIAVLSVLLIFLPTAEKLNFESVSAFPFDLVFAAENGLVALLSVITIFLYKNRDLQTKMCYLILVLLVAVIATIAYDIWEPIRDTMTTVEYKIPISFPLIAIIFDLLAIRSIKKDEKLVRSLDRLR
ncbi:MAG: DUF4293 domain-containing protein [Bacteroidales bacterium]|nr:DUF4293 domain-containing protein [Bacteroidales bacterium]